MEKPEEKQNEEKVQIVTNEQLTHWKLDDIALRLQQLIDIMKGKKK